MSRSVTAFRGGGVITDFTRHPAPSLNDSGTVAFDAAISSAQSAEGIFLAKGGEITTLAEVGGDAPGVVAGTFVVFDTPSVNNRDEVVFVASVRHLRELHEVVYLYSNGCLRKLLEERDPYLAVALPGLRGAGDQQPGRGGFAGHAGSRTRAGGFVTGTRDLKCWLVPARKSRRPDDFAGLRRIAIDDDDNIAFGAQGMRVGRKPDRSGAAGQHDRRYAGGRCRRCGARWRAVRRYRAWPARAGGSDRLYRRARGRARADRHLCLACRDHEAAGSGR